MYDLNRQEHVLFLCQLFVHEPYRILPNVNDHTLDRMQIVDRNLIEDDFKQMDICVFVVKLTSWCYSKYHIGFDIKNYSHLMCLMTVRMFIFVIGCD